MSSQLEIKGLSVTFARGEERVHAVTDVTMSIGAGEIIGLVGESGCGKSVTTKAILRLFYPMLVSRSADKCYSIIKTYWIYRKNQCGKYAASELL